MSFYLPQTIDEWLAIAVPLALKTLGYAWDEIEAITKHVDEHDTIEGASALKDVDKFSL